MVFACIYHNLPTDASCITCGIKLHTFCAQVINTKNKLKADCGAHCQNHIPDIDEGNSLLPLTHKDIDSDKEDENIPIASLFNKKKEMVLELDGVQDGMEEEKGGEESPNPVSSAEDVNNVSRDNEGNDSDPNWDSKTSQEKVRAGVVGFSEDADYNPWDVPGEEKSEHEISDNENEGNQGEGGNNTSNGEGGNNSGGNGVTESEISGELNCISQHTGDMEDPWLQNRFVTKNFHYSGMHLKLRMNGYDLNLYTHCKTVKGIGTATHPELQPGDEIKSCNDMFFTYLFAVHADAKALKKKINCQNDIGC